MYLSTGQTYQYCKSLTIVILLESIKSSLFFSPEITREASSEVSVQLPCGEEIENSHTCNQLIPLGDPGSVYPRFDTTKEQQLKCLC